MMGTSTQSRAPAVFERLTRRAYGPANRCKGPLYQIRRPGEPDAPHCRPIQCASCKSIYVVRIMDQSHCLSTGQRSLFYVEQDFVFQALAEHTVFPNWELMALRQRNLVLIGGEYQRARWSFWHNQSLDFRSIYYR